MSVPPLRLDSNIQSYISGEVIIHPSAVLAPGVILQAAPNSKIIIGSGVCVGMGSILQVDEGTLEIEAGVNLGAGFLMVGKGKIGANACIGSATTVFHCSVEPGQVVAPGSILGDTSRQKEETEKTQKQDTQNRVREDTQNKENASASPPVSSSFSAFRPAAPQPASPSIPKLTTTEQTQEPIGGKLAATNNSNALTTQNQQQPDADSPNNIGPNIYGQTSIQRLLTTLFPHRQSLNNPPSNGQSE